MIVRHTPLLCLVSFCEQVSGVSLEGWSLTTQKDPHSLKQELMLVWGNMNTGNLSFYCNIWHNKHHILYIAMDETTKFTSFTRCHHELQVAFCVRTSTFSCRVTATDVMMFLIHCNWAKHIYMPDLSPIFSKLVSCWGCLAVVVAVRWKCWMSFFTFLKMIHEVGSCY